MDRFNEPNSKSIGLPDENGKYLCDCSFHPEPHRVARRTWYTHQKTYSHRSSKNKDSPINGAQSIDEHNSGSTTDIWDWSGSRELGSSSFSDNEDENDNVDSNHNMLDAFSDYEDDVNRSDELNYEEEEEEEELSEYEHGEDMQIDEDDEWELERLRALSRLISSVNDSNL